MVNSINVPVGLLVPVLLPSKLFLGTCARKRCWVIEISGRQAVQWWKWLEDVTHCSYISMNRCMKDAWSTLQRNFKLQDASSKLQLKDHSHKIFELW